MCVCEPVAATHLVTSELHLHSLIQLWFARWKTSVLKGPRSGGRVWRCLAARCRRRMLIGWRRPLGSLPRRRAIWCVRGG